MLTSWFHVTSLVIYFGSLVGLGLILIPAFSAIEDHERRATLLVRALRLYNPLQIGVLGVLVVSGAFQLTELKSAHREFFLKEVGWTLAWKLAAAFVLILLSTYQSMGVAHRFVRRYEGGERPSPHQLQSLLQRLKVSTWAILCLGLIAAWLGLRLRR